MATVDESIKVNGAYGESSLKQSLFGHIIYKNVLCIWDNAVMIRFVIAWTRLLSLKKTKINLPTFLQN